MSNYDNCFVWKCAICGANFPHEPGIALHILEEHDINILLWDEVKLDTLRIILPERPKFWTRVESWEDIGANDEIEIKEEIFIADTEEFDTDEGNDDNNAVSGDKPFPNFDLSNEQPCYIYGINFATKKDLATHRKTHNGQRPFTCDKCPKTYASWVMCEMHKLRHTPEWSELENDSKKLANFRRNFTLERRKWRMKYYKPPKLHECPHCGKTFKWASNLRHHIAGHGNDRSFICTTCSSRYRNSYSLRMHIASANCSKVILTSFSRPFQCELCLVRVKTEKLLRSHRKTVHGINPPPPLRCRTRVPNVPTWRAARPISRIIETSIPVCDRIGARR
ncbi:putative zinc finger protein 840 [Folsomia candida]|nr:putative zinc finger protein 840 [Folsomia candida]